MNNEYDYIIIGSGIVGLSTAYNLLQKNKKLKVLILEKEDKIAYHQTGHNSGVIHAGVYYKPGSLKSKFCKMGVDATVKFCTKYQIPYEQCGKLIVATNKDELTKMFDLEERCKLNGLKTKILSKKKLIEIEPNILGLGALKVYDSGITDYTAISKKISELIPETFSKTVKLKKSGIASIFTASLELTKDGIINIMQEKLFGDILIKKSSHTPMRLKIK